MQLVHYYVQKGFDWDKIASASATEKVFLRASMEKAFEEEEDKYKALFGGVDNIGKKYRCNPFVKEW